MFANLIVATNRKKWMEYVCVCVYIYILYYIYIYYIYIYIIYTYIYIHYSVGKKPDTTQ